MASVLDVAQGGGDGLGIPKQVWGGVAHLADYMPELTVLVCKVFAVFEEVGHHLGLLAACTQG